MLLEKVFADAVNAKRHKLHTEKFRAFVVKAFPVTNPDNSYKILTIPRNLFSEDHWKSKGIKQVHVVSPTRAFVAVTATQLHAEMLSLQAYVDPIPQAVEKRVEDSHGG